MADDPREGVPLTNPACDELDVLCSKVEDQNRPRRGIDELHELFAFFREGNRRMVLNAQQSSNR